MKIKTIRNICCGENTFVFNDGSSVGIVDPGDQPLTVISHLHSLHQEKLEIKILLTHGHYDHIAGIKELCDNLEIEGIYIGENEERYLYQTGFNLSSHIGKEYELSQYKDKVHTLKEGDKVSVGKFEFHVIDTPGHTTGGVFYVCDSEKTVFSGDSLFKRSIGNTSFPGGNHQQLIDSLKRALNMIPDDFVVYPGHEDTTKIGSEKKKNPYL